MLKALLPTTVDARVRVIAIATLVAQILIVGTGGAVRLTGSGLGCPTWPLCTDASLVATPEMGIHGAIEFGNRLLSIIVGFVAVALLVIVLLRLRAAAICSCPPCHPRADRAAGLIGGISVRVRLDPSTVGVHFLTSVVLVARRRWSCTARSAAAGSGGCRGWFARARAPTSPSSPSRSWWAC